MTPGLTPGHKWSDFGAISLKMLGIRMFYYKREVCAPILSSHFKFKQKPEVLLQQMANLSYSPSTSYHFREARPFDSTASDGMFCP